MATRRENQLAITPAVVTWARERAGFTPDEAAHHFKDIATWESGESNPTYPQLERMADKFAIPIAVFFFPAPPAIEPLKNSFRTLSDHDFMLIRRPVRGFLRKAQAMQVNLQELSEENNPANRIITKDLRFEPSAGLGNAVATVRSYLGVPLAEQQNWPSTEEALENWRDALGRVGVFVFKDAFRTEGVFGFCLYDQEFPIIYVNNSSAKTRQIFTLFHELAHLLFQTSGIDVRNDGELTFQSDAARQIEIFCNAFAGAFLVPDDTFDAQYGRLPASRETAAQLAAQFKVSREVIYRKFLDRGRITQDEYENAAAEWAAQGRERREDSGGSYYNNQFSYLGRRYIDLALTRYYQHRFDEAKLAEYLNIKPKSLEAFEANYRG